MLALTIFTCALIYGGQYGIDIELIEAIAKVESSNREKAISQDGMDFGLMQIRKKYVPETREQLLDACTSIKVASRILDFNKKNCRHKKDYTYVVCYNTGVTGCKKINHPNKFN